MEVYVVHGANATLSAFSTVVLFDYQHNLIYTLFYNT